ncbi:hypothetical protein [Agathobaculum butyriciproducens]|uniref:hypothetical protein n=1 Tax=Agathobaculum butyriciproducens TaxID=1628085 RepID=UPI0036D39DE6
MFTTETGIGVVIMVVFAAFWLAFMLWEDWGQAGKTARARASAKANGWEQDEMQNTITRNGAIIAYRLMTVGLFVVMLVDIIAFGKNVSEFKAAEIDDEIHRIIEHAYHACEKLLSEHMDEMKRVAEYLIRNETMDGETFVKVYNGEIVPDKIVGEDLMTELQQELHAKVSKPAESAEELAKVEEAEKDLDPDKQDQ